MNEAAVGAWARELGVALPSERLPGAAAALAGHVDSALVRRPEILAGIEPANLFEPEWKA